MIRLPLRMLSLLLTLASMLHGLEVGVGHDRDKFGPVLPAIAELGSVTGMAVDIDGDFAYLIGNGVLTVVDIQQPSKPRIVSRLQNLGTTRQIVVREGLAYIVSRGDGMFIVDVSDPSQPELLSTYDSVEFATGLAIGGDVAFLACRLYGVELVDISDPENPEHISLSRTGVSQSVTYADGYIYVGVWSEMEVVVVDVRDPWNPQITDRLRLDGYGDGVAVYEGHLYAATGQHSRARPKEKPGDPGFGTGHGLEIFSLEDPAHPRLASRTKFPQDDHTDSHLWTVRVANDHAFVVDNYNGLFAVNVADPSQPSVVGQHQMPYFEERKGAAVMSGLALAKDHVVIMSPYMDARVIGAPGLADEVSKDLTLGPKVGTRPDPKPTPYYQAHYLDGQVNAVARDGDIAYVAAGQSGLHIARIWPEFKRLSHIPTKDRVQHLYLRNEKLYVAEGTQGLAIWNVRDAGALKLKGRYSTNGETAKQVMVPESEDYAVLMVGPHSIHIVDVSDPEHPKKVFREHGEGILTGDNIADGLFEDRYVGVYWHKSGHYHRRTDRIRWYDLKHPEGPKYVQETTLGRIKTANGVTVVNDKVLVVANGGYRLIDPLESRNLQSLPTLKLPGISMIGKPTIHGNELYVTHRAGGEVWMLDISDLRKPKLMNQFETRANPCRILPHPDCLLIPGGYEGLLVYHSQ